MKKLFFCLLLSCMYIFFSCSTETNTADKVYETNSTSMTIDSSKAEELNPVPVPTPVKMVSLDVEDEEGTVIKLTPESDELVFAFGSWCPHSTNLLRALSASDYASFFDKKKIIFLLDTDEIDNFKQRLKSSGEYSDEELTSYFEELNETKKYSKIVDPKCLQKLSKFTYYYANHNNLQVNGVPNYYNAITGVFERNYLQPISNLYSKKNFDLTKSFINYFQNLEKQKK